MTISNNGTLASVVKQGDYLVFKAEKLGITVEYSPDAPPENPVIGSFAARNGRANFFNAVETAQIMQENPANPEEILIRGMETLSNAKRPKSLVEKIMDAIRIYADSGYSTTLENPIWYGKTRDFHRNIVQPLTGLVYRAGMLKVYRRVATLLPGVQVESDSRVSFVTVDWKMVESPM